MPQPQQFDECPQCGVLVSKYKESQEKKAEILEAERKEREEKEQKERERARKLEEQKRQQQQQDADRKRAREKIRLATEAIQDQISAVPEEAQQKLYPGMVFNTKLCRVVSVLGPIIILILGILAGSAAGISGNKAEALLPLIASLLFAGLTWLSFRYLADVNQIMLGAARFHGK
jgi:Flp pilus assembly protein TadB